MKTKTWYAARFDKPDSPLIDLQDIPRCFVVITENAFAVESTPKICAEKLLGFGCSKKDRALLRLVIGDDKATVTFRGELVRDAGTALVNIGDNFTLGILAK